MSNNLNQVWSVVCSYVQVDGYKLGCRGTKLIYKGAGKCTLGCEDTILFIYCQ